MRSSALARAAALSCAAGLGCPASAQSTNAFPERVCNVRSFGAEGSRIFPDTTAFQKAIDDCAGKGGGTVEVPRGEYLTGPLFLKSNIRLHLAPYSELFFSTDPDLYR